MKKIRLILLVIIFCLSFLMTACKENKDKDSEDNNDIGNINNKEVEQDPVHVHQFTKKIIKDEYKVSDATCTEGSRYYYTCECGEIGTETFQANDRLGHDFKDGIYFYTNLEIVGVIVPEGVVRVFFHCDRCNEDVYVDYSIDEHEHICHEATHTEGDLHESTCAICGETFVGNCVYDENNECYYCNNDKVPTFGDNLWKMSQEATVVTQNEVKAYFYGKGEEKYNSITVTCKEVNYSSGIGCSLNKAIKKFQYESDKDNYYDTDRNEVGSYGWYPVNFKISKCVDAIGETIYYKFDNGNIGIYFNCNGECQTDTYHEYNSKGQLLVYKVLNNLDENNKELKVYTYSYGKEW